MKRATGFEPGLSREDSRWVFRRHVTLEGGKSRELELDLGAVDELDVDLPATAIGKDYIDRAGFAGTPSGTGFQFLVHGVFGVTLALDEGIELNLLGATYGVDLYPPALKLPCIGRLGF